MGVLLSLVLAVRPWKRTETWHGTGQLVLFYFTGEKNIVAWLPPERRYDLICRVKISIATAHYNQCPQLHSVGCSEMKSESPYS